MDSTWIELIKYAFPMIVAGAAVYGGIRKDIENIHEKLRNIELDMRDKVSRFELDRIDK